MFGINPSEFIVLLAVAAVVLGPERLPQYAAQLARVVRELRKMAQGATAQVRSEMGPEFDDIDWRKLDPRQYDPRRIVREALSDMWDPDDPLGMNEKPVTPGGPADVAAATAATENPVSQAWDAHEKARQGAATGSNGNGNPSPLPPFDPDAT